MRFKQPAGCFAEVQKKATTAKCLWLVQAGAPSEEQGGMAGPIVPLAQLQAG